MKLAIITARGGSKRIPRKNIRLFCGEPIIKYSVQAALESGCFDEVMVSTDDHEIAAVAEKLGAKVPFMRSEKTASDHATTTEVMLEVMQLYQARNVNLEFVCCLYPTAPFITKEVLVKGLNLLLENNQLLAAMPVTRFSYPIQRALKMNDHCVSFFHPEHVSTRSQDLPAAYHDAGQFYWVRAKEFLITPRIISDQTAGVVLPEWQVQDIDNEEDWVLAEMKFRYIQEYKRT